MSSSPLEMPPPPPSQVGQSGSPSLSGLAGDQQNGQGDQSLQIVTQHLMEAENALQQAAELKPELSVILDKFINDTKPQIGQILFGGGQQQQPPMQAMSNPMMAGGMQPGMNMRP